MAKIAFTGVVHLGDLRMRWMTAREARRCFGRLLSSVAKGEQVVITKRGRSVAVVSPYRSDTSEDRKMAIKHLKQVMDEPIISAAGFRTFTRDEMHERD